MSNIFATYQNYIVDRAPGGIAVADFNKDGKIDIVTANGGVSSIMTNTGTISVLLGKGDGTFLTHADYQVGRPAQGIAVADFNNDGNLDIAVTITSGDNYSDGNTISVLLGKVGGTFAAYASYVVGNLPEAIVVADFNKDHNIDIVTCNNRGNSISVLLGRGDGTFAPKVDLDINASPVDMAVADFNNDGNPDLAVTVLANSNSGVIILQNNGYGAFVKKGFYALNYPNGVTTADFNNDGNVDMAITDDYDTWTSGCTVFFGHGNGNFATSINYIAGSGGIAAASFRNNGNVDLVTASGNGLLLGFGNGTFASSINYPYPTGLYIAAADFNNDGKTDVAMTSTSLNPYCVSVLINIAPIPVNAPTTTATTLTAKPQSTTALTKNPSTTFTKTTTDTPENSQAGHSSDTPAIVGGIFGAIALLSLIVVGWVVHNRYYHHTVKPPVVDDTVHPIGLTTRYIEFEDIGEHA